MLRGVHERVHLEHDPRLLAREARLDRLAHLLQEPVAHVVGRHDRLAVARRARRAGERVEELGHVGGQGRVAGEEAEVLVEARRLRVVVAGADVHVVAQAAALAPHHQQRLRVGLQAGQAVHHVGARLFQRRAPSRCCGARRSAPSAPPGTPPACRARPPRSATAPGPESSEVRYTVIFIASTSGSATACCTKRSTLAANEWYGWCTRMSPRAHGREQVRAAVLGLARLGLGHGLPGRVAQLAVARPRRRAPRGPRGRAARPRRPPGLVDRQLLDQVLAHARVHVVRHLEPHGLAEAAAAQLVLDRLQEVVGLVGDGEVGVARDAEEGVAHDLHAREERAEVAGDDRLERARTPFADLQQPREHLLRHLHPREHLVRRPPGRAARPRCDSERFEMYGNGRPGPTASGVSTGKICSSNIRSISASSSASRSSRSITRIPCSASAGPDDVLPLARRACGQLACSAR